MNVGVFADSVCELKDLDVQSIEIAVEPKLESPIPSCYWNSAGSSAARRARKSRRATDGIDFTWFCLVNA
ncbi:hypothetical protein ACFX2A_015480 [Malus domestica]